MTIGQSRAAFTLIEVLIVIVLIGLLFAAIVPTLNDQGGDLNEAARWMRTVISMARAEAMNESARYRLEFDADGQMRVLRQEDPLTAPARG